MDTVELQNQVVELKKLVSEGYIKRMEHHVDTRAKSVHLTKKGEILAEKLIPIVEKIDEDFFASIKKSERRTLIDILNHVVENTNTFL